jgi:uncharacterized protein (DUF488 family)
MLNRQRIVVAALAEAGGTLHRTNLVKLAFLLREETVIGNDPTFYDFVPYRFGPFSFALWREVEALARDGCVSVTEESVSLREPAKAVAGVLPANTHDAVRSIVATYAKLPLTKLLLSVYERYPWYASRSELQELRPKEYTRGIPASPAVYTIGYEGRSVDAFFSKLLSSHLAGIVDVRANPVSRKYGFASRSMAEIGRRLGLQYHHLPELGVPPSERTDLAHPGAREALLRVYEEATLPERAAAIETAAHLVSGAPMALLCMEADPARCHRGRLAPAVSRVAGLPVAHL